MYVCARFSSEVKFQTRGPGWFLVTVLLASAQQIMIILDMRRVCHLEGVHLKNASPG